MIDEATEIEAATGDVRVLQDTEAHDRLAVKAM
jgi:hypothetical protein